jgi:hypothetical protein
VLTSNMDGGLTDGLPVRFRNDMAVRVAKRTVHGGAGPVRSRHTHLSVILAVLEGPENRGTALGGTVQGPGIGQ